METEKLKKTLIEIGFTYGESEVYLTLLKIGESKVGPIIKSSDISRSKVYDILERLIQKGLAGKIDKNGILYYKPSEANRILNILKEKEKRLKDEEKTIKEIIPSLESLKPKKDIKVSVYEGFEGFKSVIDKTIEELDKTDSYEVMGISKTTESMRIYASKIYEYQKIKKFKARSIFDELGAHKMSERKNPLHEMKILPKGWHTPALFTIYKDNIGIHLGNDEKIVSILIKSEDIAESFKANFEAMWRISKPQSFHL